MCSRRIARAVLFVMRAKAAFVGAKTVSCVELDVEFRASTKPNELFARGPVTKLANVESSGYPDSARRSAYHLPSTQRVPPGWI